MSELLPAGTVTLLLADVEGSTRLWETQPEEMTAALARLDQVVSTAIAAHNGVRPLEQGEGDSFVAAFARASDAVKCALDLQRARLAPIRMRIGIHTGEVQLRDENNYAGPAVNRTARLRDLAHGGQTVLSGAAEDMVVDLLPDGAWLTDLGTHQLRDLLRPERVVQLCHPDLRNEFPPLRTVNNIGTQGLPVEFTTFVGRREQLIEVCQLVVNNRLVTLTGTGGVGKTRMAVQVATRVADDLGGLWCVDLAPITEPDLAASSVARAVGLLDQPGRTPADSVVRFLSRRRGVLVLDNCEHLLNATAALVVDITRTCTAIKVLTTSREPLGVAGEVTWRVPSLSLTDESVQLFADRARAVRPDFLVTERNSTVVGEICTRLDGLPLAIELAAARVRALAPEEILDGLHDRFRLLTGGAHTAVRRQQTLLASVEWSHAMLTEPEQILLRRLAVFVGGFDLDAARSVCADAGVESYQVLDELTLLVDKSLVIAENTGSRTRYRLLETVRQYALEKLGGSGESDEVRNRHRDHYSGLASQLDASTGAGYDQRLHDVEIEFDNLRAAFAWSRESQAIDTALILVSEMQPFWLGRGRVGEGLAWFDAILRDGAADHGAVTPSVRALAYASCAFLKAWLGGVGLIDSIELATKSLDLAQQVGDRALMVRALIACGCASGYHPGATRQYLAEALELAHELGDEWRVGQILAWRALGAFLTSNPLVVRAAAIEARQVAETVGDHVSVRQCRLWLAWAQVWQGDLATAIDGLRELIADADAAGDLFTKAMGLETLCQALVYHGDLDDAMVAAREAVDVSEPIGGVTEGWSHIVVAYAALAAGDVATAAESSRFGWPLTTWSREVVAIQLALMAQIALASGDTESARRYADDGVADAIAWSRMTALAARARIAMAEGDFQQAEQDAHAALACGVECEAWLLMTDVLECLASSAAVAESYPEAARLFGAADAVRQRTGETRYRIYQDGYDASVAELRAIMGDDFDVAWDEGAALSLEQAIAYAQRGRGERKRPSSGWASLTPAELEVVKLAVAGLPSKDIAARLFVSPRTVQTHLTHIYGKLGVASRVQLAQEAARHA
ncbi:LuxR C-terminal-related transcriptional regulator [Mycobacterium sp. SMC-17]|uniref:helix-turn-helix transcriptional regulator n=1 Tax=Mycobacterium sp. SMC-17 TaxID=3381628 RepID=UPI0038778DA0